MDFAKTVFISPQVSESQDCEIVLEQYILTGHTICVVFEYANREHQLSSFSKKHNFQKGIQLTTSAQAQNYHNFKKGKTKAGVIDVVIYQPDFSTDAVTKQIRSICEKGWCDAIIGCEMSKKADGLHKKRHTITQVEAKHLFENNIVLFFDLTQIAQDVTAPQLNRIHQLLFIGKKYSVKTQGIMYFQTVETMAFRQIPKNILTLF